MAQDEGEYLRGLDQPHLDRVIELQQRRDVGKVVRLLLEAKIPVDARAAQQYVRHYVRTATTDEKEIALVLAVSQNHYKVVKVLLDAKADPCCKRARVIPLLSACAGGDIRIVTALLDAKADIHVKYDSGATAVQMAARYQRREVVALLLQRMKDEKK
jgi:ankyrin repeat protein